MTSPQLPPSTSVRAAAGFSTKTNHQKRRKMFNGMLLMVSGYWHVSLSFMSVVLFEYGYCSGREANTDVPSSTTVPPSSASRISLSRPHTPMVSYRAVIIFLSLSSLSLSLFSLSLFLSLSRSLASFFFLSLFLFSISLSSVLCPSRSLYRIDRPIYTSGGLEEVGVCIGVPAKRGQTQDTPRGQARRAADFYLYFYEYPYT